MKTTLLYMMLTLGLCEYACTQTVVSDDRLPADSIEIKRNDPPATSSPWQLPRPGDPHYDATKEAQIKQENENQDKSVTHHLVRTYERGVFIGYVTLQLGKPAKKMDDYFIPNDTLPPDAVQLSPSSQPNKADYYPSRPETRPWNMPDDYIPVRTFYKGDFIGWTFLPKQAVQMLHRKT